MCVFRMVCLFCGCGVNRFVFLLQIIDDCMLLFMVLARLFESSLVCFSSGLMLLCVVVLIDSGSNVVVIGEQVNMCIMLVSENLFSWCCMVWQFCGLWKFIVCGLVCSVLCSWYSVWYGLLKCLWYLVLVVQWVNCVFSVLFRFCVKFLFSISELGIMLLSIIVCMVLGQCIRYCCVICVLQEMLTRLKFGEFSVLCMFFRFCVVMVVVQKCGLVFFFICVRQWVILVLSLVGLFLMLLLGVVGFLLFLQFSGCELLVLC